MRRFVSCLFFVLVAISLLGAACESGEPAVGVPGEAAAVSAGPLLPAYETDEERALSAIKGDWWARSGNPEWYTITQSPAVEGLRSMVEWEPMQANTITYADYLSSDYAVRQTLVNIAVETVAAADLWVIYQSGSMRTDLESRMLSAGATQHEIDSYVHWFQISNDSIWTIDFGPLPLLRDGSGLAFLDWRYYDGREADDAIPTRLGRAAGVTTYRQPFDIEGGNFQADGEGVCYTTERAFAYGGTVADLELQLRYYAGCDELVVLRDIHDDGTGHIDMFFKLISPTEAILGSFTAAQDTTSQADMNWNASLLESRGVTVWRMPMPNASQGVPRTYLNSTLIDGPRGKVNLWPVYSVDASIEAQAEAVWEQALPSWTHIGINCDDISLLSGAIHCVTRTIPDVALEPWIADGTCSGGSCAAPNFGYTGSCSSSSDCFGPEWLCSTNACEFVEPSCTSDADCDDGDLCTTDTCDGDRCLYAAVCETPYVCDPDTGACELCEPDCAGRDCGDDGCGGTCGSCAASDACVAGACVSGCGELPYEGCCDGNVAWWCDDGALASTECPADQPYCIWLGAQYGYYCSATDGGEDPSGVYPRDCADYFSVGCEGDADCDDGDACTVDSCDAGDCVYASIADCCLSAADCDDGDLCTADSCVGNACTYSAIADCCRSDADCDDGDDCTTDTCTDGDCSYAPGPGCCRADADCDDADPCTTDRCDDGDCVHDDLPNCCGSDDDCDDLDFCTNDVCVENVCLFEPLDDCCTLDGDCDDGDLCTADSCIAHECAHGEIPGCCAADADCDDGDVCTTGRCAGNVCSFDAVAGCCHDAADCYDGNPCTADECSGNSCSNPALVDCCLTDAECDDGDPDTEDLCVAHDCQNIAVTECVQDSDCDDGDACTTDTCVGTTCARTAIADCCYTAADCDDGDACTADTCAGNACVFSPIADCCRSDSACDDGDLCTIDACRDDACTNIAIVCDEAGETCDPETGACLPVCEPDCAERECGDDGCGGICGACAAGERCDAIGQCVTTGDPCLDMADGTACDDDNPCTFGDACARGVCVGDPVVCAAPDDCHEPGVCDPAEGACDYATKADGTLCNDGDSATGADHCEAGVCVGTDCLCATDDLCCDGCFPRNEGASCDDGDAMTIDDACVSGVCEGQPGSTGDEDTSGGPPADTGWEPGTGTGSDSSSGGCAAGGSSAPAPVVLLFLLLAGLVVRRRRVRG